LRSHARNPFSPNSASTAIYPLSLHDALPISGAPADGDVIHYAFDEPDGGTAVLDSSGNGHDGTITVGLGASDRTTATDEETADRFWTLTPVDLSPVSAEVATQCRGTQAFVVVRTTNTSDARTNVTVTALGESRERDVLKPGQVWRTPFAAGASSLEAGQTVVRADGVETTHDHEAINCR